jgi:hypothetical protein
VKPGARHREEVVIMSEHDSTTITTDVDHQSQPGADQAGGANLEKVRDILFGTHMREFERRLARLEDQLIRETADLKEDVRKRLSELEHFIHEETEALAGRVETERNERAHQSADLSRTLQEAAQTSDRKASNLEDQLSRAQRELRQQILAQQQRLSEDIRQAADDVLARLQRESQELRSLKADRATLATLLTEMALRLNNELTIPGLEEAGNG